MAEMWPMKMLARMAWNLLFILDDKWFNKGGGRMTKSCGVKGAVANPVWKKDAANYSCASTFNYLGSRLILKNNMLF